MARTIVGMFDDISEAQSAVRDLVDSGIPRSDISLTASDARGEYSSAAGSDRGDHAGGIGDGVASGAGLGAALGGLGGLLVGLGALAIPGVGPIIAAGPLAAALTGAGIGAVTGGIVGGLVDMGIPDEEAHAYAEGIRRGGTLVTVRTDDTLADKAAAIMRRHNPIDIDARAAEWRSSGWTGHDANAAPYTHDQITAERDRYRSVGTAYAGTDTLDTTGEVRVPVVEEEMQVGKREVERGRVRVYTHTEETPVQENVQLRQEHVTVDRRPVDRPLTDADAAAFENRSVEVREMGEEAVVAKQARVAEEVVVRKDVDTRTETISDTVRRTDVDVDEDVNTDVVGSTRSRDTDRSSSI